MLVVEDGGQSVFGGGCEGDGVEMRGEGHLRIASLEGSLLGV
jgi:hypothetical protein